MSFILSMFKKPEKKFVEKIDTPEEIAAQDAFNQRRLEEAAAVARRKAGDAQRPGTLLGGST